MRGSNNCIGNSGNKRILKAHGKKQAKGNYIGVAKNPHFSKSCNRNQNQTFDGCWKKIHEPFVPFFNNLHKQAGKKGTKKKAKNVKKKNEAATKTKVEKLLNKECKMAGYVGG